MKINNIDDLKEMAHKLNNSINEESAFEKLLKVLVGFGVEEEKAAQMIADCIDEQYELDKISKSIGEVYQDEKDIVTNNGKEYKA